jgi:hypothetical protein
MAYSQKAAPGINQMAELNFSNLESMSNNLLEIGSSHLGRAREH